MLHLLGLLCGELRFAATRTGQGFGVERFAFLSANRQYVGRLRRRGTCRRAAEDDEPHGTRSQRCMLAFVLSCLWICLMPSPSTPRACASAISGFQCEYECSRCFAFLQYPFGLISCACCELHAAQLVRLVEAHACCSDNGVGSVGCMAIIKSIVVRPLPVFLAKTAVRCVVLHV